MKERDHRPLMMDFDTSLIYIPSTVKVFYRTSGFIPKSRTERRSSRTTFKPGSLLGCLSLCLHFSNCPRKQGTRTSNQTRCRDEESRHAVESKNNRGTPVSLLMKSTLAILAASRLWFRDSSRNKYHRCMNGDRNVNNSAVDLQNIAFFNEPYKIMFSKNDGKPGKMIESKGYSTVSVSVERWEMSGRQF